MTTDPRPVAHDHDTPDTATDRVHDTSWSANLELPRHAADRDLVVAGAVAVVEHTTAGHHVNLVTHDDHGHPETYLYDAPAERSDGVAYEYVEQYDCGGHVTRMYVERSRSRA